MLTLHLFRWYYSLWLYLCCRAYKKKKEKKEMKWHVYRDSHFDEACAAPTQCSDFIHQLSKRRGLQNRRDVLLHFGACHPCWKLHPCRQHTLYFYCCCQVEDRMLKKLEKQDKEKGIYWNKTGKGRKGSVFGEDESDKWFGSLPSSRLTMDQC